MYIGIMYSMCAFGPVCGFLLGAYLLSHHVDTFTIDVAQMLIGKNSDFNFLAQDLRNCIVGAAGDGRIRSYICQRTSLVLNPPSKCMRDNRTRNPLLSCALGR